jgi:Arc/MetJ family transcription regulator
VWIKACHAGGRGFESRGPRQPPASQHLQRHDFSHARRPLPAGGRGDDLNASIHSFQLDQRVTTACPLSFGHRCGRRLQRTCKNFRDPLSALTQTIDEYTKISEPYTSGEHRMRTNIDIDDRLMRQAMRSSGARTKRAAVEEGLRLLIQTRGQKSIRRLRGKVAWEGDLETSRLGRVAE